MARSRIPVDGSLREVVRFLPIDQVARGDKWPVGIDRRIGAP